MKNIRPYIHESNLIEGFDSDIADEQSIQAWQWLITRTAKDRKLTHEIIQKLQARIVEHQQLPGFGAGSYRDRSRVHVTIAGRAGMNPMLIPNAMDGWLELWGERTPKENHIIFEHIHPFIDGNGRTGRMLMWFQEHYVDGIEPTLVRKREVQDYYRWF